MENVSKKELIDAITSKSGLTKKDAQKALEAMVESVVAFTKKGCKVSLIGFGGFFPYKTKATTKKNPKTGNPVEVPAKTVLKFKSSKNIQL